ncbi:MAG: DUF6526 family protein [Ginsengibacter sp.]
MQVQNYKNHSRIVPLYHLILSIILIACLIFSVWNMYRAYERGSGRLVAATLCGFCIAFFIIEWYARTFAIVAQDRAIRAEENLRHFALTGKLLDKRLTMPQVIALRFADDTEFLILSEKAANENMKSGDIKKAIVNWRADHHRA